MVNRLNICNKDLGIKDVSAIRWFRKLKVATIRPANVVASSAIFVGECGPPIMSAKQSCKVFPYFPHPSFCLSAYILNYIYSSYCPHYSWLHPNWNITTVLYFGLSNYEGRLYLQINRII